jgi:AcrR family transcriptional regulator
MREHFTHVFNFPVTDTTVSVQTSRVTEQRVLVVRSAGDASPRRSELLEASYQYVLEHGLVDMSLRPMAAAVGSSPRVLLYLFGSKDDLVRALLARARQDELVLLNNLSTTTRGATLRVATEQLWEWLVAPEHHSLLRLWFEGYARSLVDGTGPWAGFARQTVDDWLELLSRFQPTPWRNTDSAAAERTHILAVLRGCLADLLATGDVGRTTAAVSRALSAKPVEARPIDQGRT